MPRGKKSLGSARAGSAQSNPAPLKKHSMTLRPAVPPLILAGATQPAPSPQPSVGSKRGATSPASLSSSPPAPKRQRVGSKAKTAAPAKATVAPVSTASAAKSIAPQKQTRRAQPEDLGFKPLTDAQMKGLINEVNASDQGRFSSLLRAAAPGYDEHLRCATAFKIAKTLSGNPDALKGFLTLVHLARTPTGYTAHDVTLSDGTTSKGVHPTSWDNVLYDANAGPNGGVRAQGHWRFDNARSKVAEDAHALDNTMGPVAASMYTLNHFMQPPFAKNSNVKKTLDDPKALEAHIIREFIKTLDPNYNPNRTQSILTPWYPGGRPDGSFSPRRVRRSRQRSPNAHI